MGRIQRKKPETRKKKKRSENGEPTQPLNGIAQNIKKAALPQGSAAGFEVKKRFPVPVKKSMESIASAPIQKGKDIVSNALQFLREVKIELKKVVWPSRKQTLGSTAVAIILVTVVSLFLGIIDLGLSNLMRWALQ